MGVLSVQSILYQIFNNLVYHQKSREIFVQKRQADFHFDLHALGMKTTELCEK